MEDSCIYFRISNCKVLNVIQTVQIPHHFMIVLSQRTQPYEIIRRNNHFNAIKFAQNLMSIMCWLNIYFPNLCELYIHSSDPKYDIN